MTRIQHRQTNGRFRQTGLERDFGLRTAICAHCGSINPYNRRPVIETSGFIDSANFNVWDRPTVCNDCGKSLPED